MIGHGEMTGWLTAGGRDKGKRQYPELWGNSGGYSYFFLYFSGILDGMAGPVSPPPRSRSATRQSCISAGAAKNNTRKRKRKHDKNGFQWVDEISGSPLKFSRDGPS